MINDSPVWQRGQWKESQLSPSLADTAPGQVFPPRRRAQLKQLFPLLRVSEKTQVRACMCINRRPLCVVGRHFKAQTYDSPLLVFFSQWESWFGRPVYDGGRNSEGAEFGGYFWIREINRKAKGKVRKCWAKVLLFQTFIDVSKQRYFFFPF